MFRQVLLFLILFNLYSYEEDPNLFKCPYGCAQRYLDSDIIQLQKLMNELIRDIRFHDGRYFVNSLQMKHLGERNCNFLKNIFFSLKDSGSNFLLNHLFFVNCIIEIDIEYECDDDGEFCVYDPYDIEYYRNDPLSENIDKCFALENYHDFLAIISLLEEDIEKRTEGFISCTKEKINEYERVLVEARQNDDIGFEYWLELHRDITHAPTYFGYQSLEKKLTERINSEERAIEYYKECLFRDLNTLNQYQVKMDNLYSSIFDWCTKNHQLPVSFYRKGFQEFRLGNFIDALDHIKQIIELEPKFSTKVQELKGELESEVGLYHEAIRSLTEAIKLNHDNKEAYFERAACYFELGNFDESLSDYLSSSLKPSKISSDSDKMGAFSLGIVKGLLKGGMQAGLEFIPSILSSLNGLNQGLWAFARDPVHVSKEFVKASQACIEFVKNHTPQEAFVELVPELKVLLTNWDQYQEVKKGEAIGHIIGKYGVDIFASVGIAKGVKAYRELKRANNLLTYEAMAISKRNQEFIKLEAAKRAQARKQILKHQNLKIELDKQGKHILGHKNCKEKCSIFTHSYPERLVEQFSGTGSKKSHKKPGVSGYKELVNFKELIGYHVDKTTGKKTPTNWGTIHYSKKGTHIVPSYPKDKLDLK